MNDGDYLASCNISAMAKIVPSPLRARLYKLEPINTETPYIESLTSYINRLSWAYRIDPRILVAQEILPKLGASYHFQSSFSLLGAFCRAEAMSINGNGGTALDWASALAQLTMKENLQNLTLRSLARNMPFQGLLRAAPAWCSACYHEWQQKGQPIYQPLLWMLQVVTVCQRHQRKLEGRCSFCQKQQSMIAARMRPGCCTQCMAWLGRPPRSEIESEIDEEERSWQQWVLAIIEELRQARTSPGILPWEQLAGGLALCSQIIGSAKQLASLIGVSKQLLSSWINHKQIPSFGRILNLCYVLDISPQLLMSNNLGVLKEALEAKERYRQPLSRQRLIPHPMNRMQALALIHAILDGREAPMGVRQLERRLGLGARTLIYHFPQECALITTQYQNYRSRQAERRMERGCNEIRQAALKLYVGGTNPSAQQVAAMLSDPGMMRTPEGLTAWHAARRELGLES